MNHREQAGSDQVRAEVYRLLAACFCEPDLAAMREELVFDQLVDGFETCCDRAVEDSRRLAAEAENADATELLVEYSRLFVGPNQLLAPPYGSVYLDAEPQVMGASTLRVAETYRRGGLSLADDVSDLPDHVAIELEFLALVSSRAAQDSQQLRCPAEREWTQLHDEFLLDLVSTWIPSFTTRILELSESSFYKHLAKCLQAFVTQETDRASQRIASHNSSGA